MKNNPQTKAMMKNVTNQLLKVNLKNRARKNALQNAKEIETRTCHIPQRK